MPKTGTPHLFFLPSGQKAGIHGRLRLPLEWTGVNPSSTKVPMKVLAQTNPTITLKRLLPKRTFRYLLVKPRTSVPSTLEFMRVNNATVREGRSHRVWPPEVLRKFQMAEIVTDVQPQHYVLRDRSISPVSR